MKRVAVVGGGIAGLAVALHLRDRAAEVDGGLEVTLLEAGERVGGNIHTDREGGWTIERGPNGYLDNAPDTLALVRRLGLEGTVRKADESAAKRFIYRAGRLHRVPTSPPAFLRSPLLSRRGRARVMLEPFGRRRPDGIDETVFQFASRRIGREAASVLVDAMVSGVYAGDVRALSLRSTFPKMAAMEEEHGGLVRAMIARRRNSNGGGPAGPAGTLTSFAGGMDTLVDAFRAELGSSIRTGVPIHTLHRGGAATAGTDGAARSNATWRLVAGTGDDLEADGVVLAIPASGAAGLLEPVDAPLAAAIGGIPRAGLAVVALGFDAAALGGAPDGFGFLVPRGEGLRILGCLWDSSIFPDRAPAAKVLVRAMIGGAHDPTAVREDDETLVRAVRAELEQAMGISVKPELARVYRHPNGISQYAVGHEDRLTGAADRLRGLPGLWLAGSSYHGVAMNACIQHARTQADEIVSRLSA